MKKGNEVFVGIDMAEAHNAVAVAEAGRDGEVRYLGTFDNAPDAVVRQTGWTLPGAALLLRSRIDGTRAVSADSTVHWIKKPPFLIPLALDVERRRVQSAGGKIRPILHNQRQL